MFFYIDESGHTGNNLFDEDQPFLYYGLLSSKTSLDALAKPLVSEARTLVGGVDRLHASELGMKGIAEISPVLNKVQKKFRPIFEMYRIAKADHAAINFFDQVFDQGLNPAVPWTAYWTPLRYVLLIKVAVLFDEEILKLAWDARLDRNDKTSDAKLIEVCDALITRVFLLPDERSRQIIHESLTWAKLNTRTLGYNCLDKSQVLQVSPNIIGFQFVMHAIASRIRDKKGARRIVVDQQSQFNKAQRTLAEYYKMTRDVPWYVGPGLPQMDLSNIPETPIEFSSSMNSAGLELVDIYIRIFKQVMERGDVPPELFQLIRLQSRIGRASEMSIASIQERWIPWLDSLPNLDELSEKDLSRAAELREHDENRRMKALSESGIK